MTAVKCLWYTFYDAEELACIQVNTKSRARKMGILEEDLKLPPAVDIAAAPAREKDWPNVLTAHANEPAASTWHISRYRHAPYDPAHLTIFKHNVAVG